MLGPVFLIRSAESQKAEFARAYAECRKDAFETDPNPPAVHRPPSFLERLILAWRKPR
jgi:hypothetical protein